MTFATVNPVDGEMLATFECLTDDQVEDRLAAAASCFRLYRSTTFAERAALLVAAAELLLDEADELSHLVTTEMGKPRRAAEAEISKSASVLRYYATHAEGFLADSALPDPSAVGARRAYVRFEPLGAVLGVMPWNYPVWQVMRFAAPLLAAGNVALVKPAPNVPQTAIRVHDLLRRAGFPEGAFQTLLIETTQVEALLHDRRVVGVALTGGEAAGRAVARVAGDEVKPAVLELGGSDPFIVLPSADVRRAARVGVAARAQNSGQACIAAKRFIVHSDVYDEFVREFTASMVSLRVGDPWREDVDVGPLATERGRAAVADLVDDACRRGATAVCGGRPAEGPGWFYPPTILTGITPAMRIHHEEVFGPVATVYEVADLDAALALANATPFGLSASVWTDDPSEQDRATKEIEAGAVFCNGMSASYPELPFGGIKRSGFGRELGEAGIVQFCNTKTVWLG